MTDDATQKPRSDGLFSVLGARIKDPAGLDALHALRAETADLEMRLEGYRSAFEATAADRDRLSRLLDELLPYKAAFESTAIDRDQWKSRHDNLAATSDSAASEHERLAADLLSLRSQSDALRRDNERLSAEVEELTPYRHAFETTRDDRDQWIARCEELRKAHDALSANFEAALKTIEDYRHAFEATAADRDRLLAETADVATLRAAFDETAADRDRIAAELEEIKPYRSAFDDTAIDRDQWMTLAKSYEKGIGDYIAARGSKARPLPPPPSAARSLVDKVVQLLPEARADLERQATGVLPNVFCVGAPKSGTSFLYSALREHPRIEVCEKDQGALNEFGFLTKAEYLEDTEIFRERGVRRYLNHTAHLTGNRPVICDFDVHYIEKIQGHNAIYDYISKDARIIIGLRNPVERALSHHAMSVIKYDPVLGRFAENLDFISAVNAEYERSIADYDACMMHNAYIHMGKYSIFVKNYIEKFGSDNVFVYIYEQDLADCAPDLMMKCFNFLGLDDADTVRIMGSDLSAFRELSRKPDNVEVFIVQADGQRRPLAESFELVSEVSVIKALEIEANGKVVESIQNPSFEEIQVSMSIPGRFRNFICVDQKKYIFDRHFKEDVLYLEEVLGRDLSCWYNEYK